MFFSKLLIVVTALLIAGTGFVRADTLLCQASCEYSAMNQVDIPPCCKSQKNPSHTAVMVADNSFLPTECPHVGSSSEIMDPLVFTVTVNHLPKTPKVHILYIAVDTSSMQLVPVQETAGFYHKRNGLSPPGLEDHPHYLVNCSFLI